MLSFANINEAWGGVVRKKSKTETKKVKKETYEQIEPTQCKPEFGTVCDPIVIRITDPRIMKELSIYNEDYKQDILMDIIKKGLLHKKEAPVVVEPVVETKVVQPVLSPIDTIINTFLDEEYKEIISVIAISIFLLFLIEGIKKYNRL